jgi:parallel beta-helix repeat protein
MTRQYPTTETRIGFRTILSAGVLAVLLACAGTAAGATTWVVDDDGGAGVDYTTIQAAVDAASAGDTIEVRGGTYIENVDVDKRLTLIGDGADVVTVRAADSWYCSGVFEVRVDSVNISGFTATGATNKHEAGICLRNANHCNISNNLASNNGCGIQLDYSSNNTLMGNNASNNGYGICLDYSSNNTLRNNIMSGNNRNFRVSVYGLFNYIQNIDTSNRVDGKPVYYWVDRHDEQVPSDAGYVGVVNSTNITVRDLTLTDNSQRVLFAYTTDSKVENVTVSNNTCGIRWDYSDNNTLAGNNASNNWDGGSGCVGGMCHGYGIYLDYSSNYNTLTGNSASNNGGGIFMGRSNYNTLRNNTMSGNNYNFGVSVYGLSDYIQNIDTSNRVDGKPVYYWVDRHDEQVPSDAGYVGVVNSTNITVRDLTLTNNGVGVLFAYTTDSKVENVTVSKNRDGIFLVSSSNNTLTGNIADSNDWIGVWLESSDNNTLTGNIANLNEFEQQHTHRQHRIGERVWHHFVVFELQHTHKQRIKQRLELRHLHRVFEQQHTPSQQLQQRLRRPRYQPVGLRLRRQSLRGGLHRH